MPPPEPKPNNLNPPDGVTLGWAWSDYLQITGHYAMVGRHGIILRGGPANDHGKNRPG